MKFAIWHNVFLALSLAILSACAPMQHRMYEGTQRPHEEIAVLSVDRQIYVTAVNGKSTGIESYDIGIPGMDLELSPGPTTLAISYSSVDVSPYAQTVTFTREPIQASFDAEKGRKYEIHYKVVNKKFTYQIVDVTETNPRKARYATWGNL